MSKFNYLSPELEIVELEENQCILAESQAGTQDYDFVDWEW